MLRFLLLHTHEWTEDSIERLLTEIRPPSADDDTLVHQILKEMQPPPMLPRRRSQP
jgi:hypothetical protein